MLVTLGRDGPNEEEPMRIVDRISAFVPCAASAAILLATLTLAHAQDQSAPPTPQRQQLLDSIAAYRGVQQKFEQSTGPFANFMGLYSRGYRCEYDETAAQRPPGVWEKSQFALWSDDKFLYGMELDSSPAVFQFQYRFLQNVIGADIYEMTRVDQNGASAGIDDSEWRLVGFGIPNPEDYTRIGIRIKPGFLTYPDVHAIGWLSACGRGERDAYDRFSPLDIDISFLQHRLDAMP
jgi:hypothetical protein